MKKSTLKYFTAMFALAFVSASVYCSVEVFAESLVEWTVSHHHNDGAVPHDHATPEPAHSHHHGNGTSPNDDSQYNDFCCSQLNGIISQWNSSISAAKSLFLMAVVHIVEQNSNFALFNAPEWLLHDKAPPSGFHFTLFYDLNFSSHAPPYFLSC